MISNHLNDVARRNQDACDLSAQIAQFLAAGGTISGPESAPPKPYGRDYKGANFQGAAAKLQADQQAARIRELAKTLNAVEICEKEAISRGVLRGIARRYGIEFTVGVKHAFAPNKLTLESEALMVIQIKECMAKGINRSQCAKALGISTTLLGRLLTDYAIDYPKMKPAFR
ncbi:hypothetical protein ACOI7N_13770 [Pseudomonas sp. P2758]|uniref:hypothetical protein n=1 Tax=Pseudomonas sp. P2758 TaxID=3409916 RepID=UPI003B5C31FB